MRIKTVRLRADEETGFNFELVGSCAFALCVKGRFELKMLNMRYCVAERSLFACMPFVSIEALDIKEDTEVMLGYIRIEDLPQVINRWVNAKNLSAVQNHPVTKISEEEFAQLLGLIGQYETALRESQGQSHGGMFRQLQTDIADLQSKLMVAHVLKVYFANISMDLSAPTHRDMVFQRFMLSLYANVREQRSVRFYAVRSSVSLKYFSTIIKQLSGKSPSQWIETVAIGEAKALLDDMENSIKNIATLLNFPDAPTFTKYFRRVTGLTPKQYRRDKTR